MPQYLDVRARDVERMINQHAPAGGRRQYAIELALEAESDLRDDDDRIFVATNNQATWNGLSTDTVRTLARTIDRQETRRLRNVSTDPEDNRDGWMVESGLMASLVRDNNAGNCDDIASYAAHRCLRRAERAVTIAYVNGNGFQHSFVLLSSRQGERVVQLDCWVPQDRVTYWNVSMWNTNDTFTLSIETVRDGVVHPGLIEIWQDWERAHRARRPRNLAGETPRADQVGRYTHPSARQRPESMNSRSSRRRRQRSVSPPRTFSGTSRATDIRSLLASLAPGVYVIDGVTYEVR
jgi:hypothetical protein